MLLKKYLTRVIAVSALTVIVVQTSCRIDADEPSPTDFGFDFTPYEGGATWTYRVDSNVKVVLLTYPPRLFDFWDANAFNTRMKEEYEVIDIVASDSVENMSFGETIHVLQRDEDFRTVRNYGLEKYSRGVGLIYSRQIAWVKKTLNDPDEVPNGFDYRYQLISFSK